MISAVKLVCAASAMFFPLAAGYLVAHARDQDFMIALLLAGIGVGMAGMFGFCAIERREG
ncbi:hypothetical protein ABE438_14605 [Bosea sp. TWI1241]|uniref:hypothetical protein n=1 Tax=Bosea sp. TWI1241 TaxID=3148904 RepID=UPI0032095D12